MINIYSISRTHGKGEWNFDFIESYVAHNQWYSVVLNSKSWIGAIPTKLNKYWEYALIVSKNYNISGFCFDINYNIVKLQKYD